MSRDYATSSRRRSPSREVDQAIALVEDRTGVSPFEILGPYRYADVVHARHLAMWLVRHRWSWSYPQIGKAFDRDHTSVMHAVSRIDGARRANPDLRRWLDRHASEFLEVDA